MERINKCISQLAFNFETLWFLDVLYNINIEVMDAERCPSPTACVMFRDFRINMYFNREFIDKLNDDELLGVILHETLHLALYHNVRNVNKHMQLWNIACDLEVNSIIESMKFKLPEGVQQTIRVMCARQPSRLSPFTRSMATGRPRRLRLSSLHQPMFP